MAEDFYTYDEVKRKQHSEEEGRGHNGNGHGWPVKPWRVIPEALAVGPREWLLGNVFCRKFVSSLVGAGGVGKTALRYAQYVSGAINRSLTGDFVFKRFR